ncbi:MAG: hypothetical protein ABI411_17950 [Tahibacter sp.]
MLINPLAGLLGFAFALLVYVIVMARSRERRAAIVAAIVAGTIAFAAVRLLHGGWQWNEQRQTDDHRQQVATVLEQDPPLAAMKQVDAETYKSTLDAVSAQEPVQAADVSALRYAARHEINFTFGLDARLKRASDEAITSYATALVDAADELAARSADLCVRYLYQTNDSTENFSELLSANARQLEGAAMADVIKSASVAAQKPTDEYEVSQLALPVVDALKRKYGAGWQIINAPYSRSRDLDQLCRISTEFYRGVLRMPTATSAKVLRHHVRRHG